MVPIDCIPISFTVSYRADKRFLIYNNKHRVVGGKFMQITTRDITWQENLIRRFPAK